MKLKFLLFYFLFFIISLLVFIFILFPEKQVAQYLSYSLSVPDSNIRVTVDNVKLSFPMHLKFKNTKVLTGHQKGHNSQIALKSLKVFLNPFSRFRDGTISIHDFSAKIKNSIFDQLNLPVVDFSGIEFDFTRKKNIITITQCTAKGSTFNIKLKGDIVITSPLQRSKLNITGVILQSSPYLSKIKNLPDMRLKGNNISKTGIKFKIQGILENPKIEL